MQNKKEDHATSGKKRHKRGTEDFGAVKKDTLAGTKVQKKNKKSDDGLGPKRHNVNTSAKSNIE